MESRVDRLSVFLYTSSFLCSPIKNFMTRRPLTIDAGLSLGDAGSLMANSHIRHLPVTREGYLVGIVSARDLMLVESLLGHNTKRSLVETAMTANPRTCSLNTPVRDVLSLMEDNGIGAFPVVDGTQIEGIFTTVDAVQILREVLI